MSLSAIVLASGAAERLTTKEAAMNAKKMFLYCQRCRTPGVLTYEQCSAYHPLVVAKMPAGFAFLDNKILQTQRINCACGALVYYGKYKAVGNPRLDPEIVARRHPIGAAG